ncbi:MAG: S8 family serine peptidase, partial [Promethearchaeota archaeon]
ISMSFGNVDPEVWNPENLAIKAAVKSGIVVVCAAGNNGPEFFSSGSPATGLYSISVGATDVNNHTIYFSSNGPSSENHLIPDLSAPGVYIISTESRNSLLGYENRFRENYISSDKNFGYIPLSGTSMACPMVAGAVAVLLEAFPDASPQSIRNALIFGAKQLERPSPEGYGLSQGAGLLNIPNSLEYLQNLNQSNVNNQAKIFPRKIPYFPYDLLKFPGDKQLVNLSVYCGKNISLEVEFPELDGIKFDYNKTFIETQGPDIISFHLYISIQYNASLGTRKGNILIKDTISGDYYDNIPIEITVAFPRGKILFDSYHGLNDFNQLNSNLGFSQIDLYHSMYDLYQLNYSLDYTMENWSLDYSPWEDGEIISPQRLSEIDLLVLQTPILPYSNFEINTIANYYNNGGSILFLGTLSQRMCINSINKLLSKINNDFLVSTENIADLNENALSYSWNTKKITDLNRSSNIFSNVSEYLFKMGNTFSVNSNSNILSTYQGKVIAASSDHRAMGKGIVIGLGDFNTFSIGTYNNPKYYGNHSLFLKNLINEMVPLDPIKISTHILRDSIIDPNISLDVNVVNPKIQIPIIGLQSPENITCDLIYGNGSIKPITLNPTVNDGTFSGTIRLNSSDASDLAFKIKIEVLSEYTSTNFLYYYNSTYRSNFNITTSVEEIDRLSKDYFQLIIESNETDHFVQPNLAVISNSFLSEKKMDEFYLPGTFGNNFSFQINPENITLGGYMITYCVANNSNNYYDFRSDRYLFPVKNYAPEINMNASTFNSIHFSDTQSDKGFYPQFVTLNKDYNILIKANDYEDSPEKLSIFVSIIPILIYNHYINILYPIEFPKFNFSFDIISQSFIASIRIPEKMQFFSKGISLERSIETDLIRNFALLWISVKDTDGSISDVIILLYPFVHEPNFSNYNPILTLFGFISLIIVLMQKKTKIFLKKRPIIK